MTSSWALLAVALLGALAFSPRTVAATCQGYETFESCKAGSEGCDWCQSHMVTAGTTDAAVCLAAAGRCIDAGRCNVAHWGTMDDALTGLTTANNNGNTVKAEMLPLASLGPAPCDAENLNETFDSNYQNCYTCSAQGAKWCLVQVLLNGSLIGDDGGFCVRKDSDCTTDSLKLTGSGAVVTGDGLTTRVFLDRTCRDPDPQDCVTKEIDPCIAVPNSCVWCQSYVRSTKSGEAATDTCTSNAGRCVPYSMSCPAVNYGTMDHLFSDIPASANDNTELEVLFKPLTEADSACAAPKIVGSEDTCQTCLSGGDDFRWCKLAATRDSDTFNGGFCLPTVSVNECSASAVTDFLTTAGGEAISVTTTVVEAAASCEASECTDFNDYAGCSLMSGCSWCQAQVTEKVGDVTEDVCAVEAGACRSSCTGLEWGSMSGFYSGFKASDNAGTSLSVTVVKSDDTPACTSFGAYVAFEAATCAECLAKPGAHWCQYEMLKDVGASPPLTTGGYCSYDECTGATASRHVKSSDILASVNLVTEVRKCPPPSGNGAMTKRTNTALVFGLSVMAVVFRL